MRLEGIAARTIHAKRVVSRTGAEGSPAGAALNDSLLTPVDRRARAAHRAAPATNVAYPTAQAMVCCRMVRNGSITSGKASRPARLPALLALYRK
jgi:hypothetical protein